VLPNSHSPCRPSVISEAMLPTPLFVWDLDIRTPGVNDHIGE
jgi:hypothetical protein